MVDCVGLVLARVELPSQSEEWFWITREVANVKDGRRVGNFVLLKVVIQSSSWAPASGRIRVSLGTHIDTLDTRGVKYSLP